LTFGSSDSLAGRVNLLTGNTNAPDYNAARDEEIAASLAARARTPNAAKIGDIATNAVQTVADAARAFNNMFTFGNADRLTGAMNLATGLTNAKNYSDAVDEEVARSKTAAARSPYATLAGQVAGGVAQNAILPGAGGEALATRWGSTLPARMAGYGLQGVITSAAQGAGNTYTGDWRDYLKNAAYGGGIGAVTGGLAGGILGNRPPASAATLAQPEELKNIAQEGYKSLENMKGIYDADPHWNQQANALEDQLTQDGFNSADSPTTWSAIERLRTGQNIQPSDLESIRQSINKIPFTRPNDYASGVTLKHAIDDFYTSPPPGTVRPGFEDLAANAAQIAQDARDNWRFAQEGDFLANHVAAARNRAASSGSGWNVDNAIRSEAARLDNPLKNKLAGYPQEIQDAVHGLVHRGLFYDAVRDIGNRMGGGAGPVGTLVGIGTGAGASHWAGLGPLGSLAVGTMTPVVGTGLRYLGNEASKNAAQDVVNMALKEAPENVLRMQVAPTVTAGFSKVASTARDVIAKQLVDKAITPPAQPTQVAPDPYAVPTY
jgi:hypothetical protein